ncbi:DUF418 domain-containing protein [Geothrix sp. SG200]|uniref:DUF418 domain-containing protein n=1 Tax=Geothrix sp. SG200 TaxID=2922865 RepID=UPI001FAB9D9C|nr:DUF418 domain-containing protein [Geothrix sp. SG200]
MDHLEARPVSQSERLGHLDALRGAALFGVLLMNVPWFFAPEARVQSLRESWPSLADGATAFLTTVFLSGKAMTLFSMLFAVGLSIQKERIEARGEAFGPFIRRRLAVLLGFGILHILLLWMGDILHAYALCGFLLLPFLGRRARTVWIWAASLWGLGLGIALVVSIFHLRRGAPPMPSAAELAAARAWTSQCLAAYGQGSWWQILVFRLRDWLHDASGLLLGGLGYSILNFLVGLGIWKSGLLKDPAAHLPLLRRVAKGGLALGLLLGLVWAGRDTPPARAWALSHWPLSRWLLPLRALTTLQPMILALGYGAGLLLLWQDETWRRRLRVLTWPGRMAFTNYLAQSLVMTGIFYHWGLGLYDRMGLASATLLGVVVYGLQVLASRWWLARFQFGPLEWIWRSLSYGRLQPFRLRGPAAG